MQLSPEETSRVINEGLAAKRLLSSDDFNDVLNYLDNFHISALVACPTGSQSADTRDHHHRMLHALRELISEITSRASVLDAYEDDHHGLSDGTDEDTNE